MTRTEAANWCRYIRAAEALLAHHAEHDLNVSTDDIERARGAGLATLVTPLVQ